MELHSIGRFRPQPRQPEPGQGPVPLKRPSLAEPAAATSNTKTGSNAVTSRDLRHNCPGAPQPPRCPHPSRSDRKGNHSRASAHIAGQGVNRRQLCSDRQLKIYDILLSIDDFGAGYSSLARLKQLPFAEVKLDTNFVQGCASNPQNAALCKAVFDLAHSFDAVAVAEGIEKPEDLRALYQMGCDLGQGYLLAAPIVFGKFAPDIGSAETYDGFTRPHFRQDCLIKLRSGREPSTDLACPALGNAVLSAPT
jgi:EAL domain